ncbi:hypothetical protein [Chryseobacterium luquanense]|uniref:Uncharacterized protein n=1 Tax=Chryseobacterium luquanense TaxID=2983766 RepID=A0ABT3Y4J2_9FLAO|nr:hypothetical protein [Chryseobacterium luquanense]MCX8533070.1 hypothetical protein [Chryseobacterium luquanense]
MILFIWGKERRAVQLAKKIIDQNSKIKILHEELDIIPRTGKTTKVFFLENEIRKVKSERQKNIDELTTINPY